MSTPASPDHSLQQQKLQLEIEKLRTETANLRKSDFRRASTWLNATTTLVAVSALVLQGVYSSMSYERSQIEAKLAQYEARDAKEQLKQIESQKSTMTSELTTQKKELEQTRQSLAIASAELQSSQRRLMAVAEQIDLRRRELALGSRGGTPSPIVAAQLQILDKTTNDLGVTFVTFRNASPVPVIVAAGASEQRVAPDADVRIALQKSSPREEISVFSTDNTRQKLASMQFNPADASDRSYLQYNNAGLTRISTTNE